MAGITQICNMALGRVSHSTPIAAIGESSNAANLCNTYFDLCRDTVLRVMQPKFATQRIRLALLEAKQTNWAFAYAYPADCIVVKQLILEGCREQLPEDRPAWKIGNIGGVKAILTDLDQAECEYITRLEDTEQWDALAVSALAWLLGSEIALPLTGKPEMGNRCMQGYQMTLASASAANLGEGEQGRPPVNEFQRARGTTSETTIFNRGN